MFGAGLLCNAANAQHFKFTKFSGGCIPAAHCGSTQLSRPFVSIVPTLPNDRWISHRSTCGSKVDNSTRPTCKSHRTSGKDEAPAIYIHAYSHDVDWRRAKGSVRLWSVQIGVRYRWLRGKQLSELTALNCKNIDQNFFNLTAIYCFKILPFKFNICPCTMLVVISKVQRMDVLDHSSASWRSSKASLFKIRRGDR